MDTRVIGFIPPIVGVSSEFNTFRLGSFYTKNLSPGDVVYLLNEKEKMVFGKAQVTSIDAGTLAEMCAIHAHKNHTELGQDPNTSPERLFRLLQKIYGPHIAVPSKKCCVVYLRRLE